MKTMFKQHVILPIQLLVEYYNICVMSFVMALASALIDGF